MRKLLLVECIPKTNDMREGVVLYEFLRMGDPEDKNYIRLVEFTNKLDLLNFLEDQDFLDEFDVIHLSGHGSESGSEWGFKLPRGTISPEEFPEDCFSGKTVSMSACELGKVGFCDSFAGQTSLKNIIAPQREVLFIDASVWFANFYYLHIFHNLDVGKAYEDTNEYLKKRVKGGFKHWEY